MGFIEVLIEFEHGSSLSLIWGRAYHVPYSLLSLRVVGSWALRGDSVAVRVGDLNDDLWYLSKRDFFRNALLHLGVQGARVNP